MALQPSDLMEMYRQMALTRFYDEKTSEWYKQGLIKESTHSCTGQEAIAIGSCYGLRPADQVLPSLRTRGAFFARGVTAREALLSAAAKKGSPSKGHETSHHTVYPELGVLMGIGMVGSSISIGVGAALAFKLKGEDSVVLNYFGDGASNRGDFHESMNLAAVWKLPVIFICENNQWSLSQPLQKSVACLKISDRAPGYGIPGYTIDGNDVFEVYDYTQAAIERARKGDGPTLLECVTYRLRPHVCVMPEMRPPEILDEWWEKCPMKRLEAYLVEKGISTVSELERIKEQISSDLDREILSVQEEPPCTVEDVLADVYEEGGVS